ncbi:MAG: hypothetical protein AAFP19_13360 [Bacteroidota bacterium]
MFAFESIVQINIPTTQANLSSRAGYIKHLLASFSRSLRKSKRARPYRFLINIALNDQEFDPTLVALIESELSLRLNFYGPIGKVGTVNQILAQEQKVGLHVFIDDDLVLPLE